MPCKNPLKDETVNPSEVSEGTTALAMYIANVVRLALVDFHVERYLSDAQMAAHNPIICNAVCTALHAYATMRLPASETFLEHHTRLIPKSWEPPQLTKSYLGLVELYRQRKNDENE